MNTKAMVCPAECEPVDLERALNFRDRNFVVEEKLDGVRVVLQVGKNSIVTGRRWETKGKLAMVKAAEPLARETFHEEIHGCVFDGEWLPDKSFHIFDLLRARGEDVVSNRWHERKRLLESLAEFLPERCRIVRSFASVRELGVFGEGIVWKDTTAKYGHGWFKAKRVETLDVTITRTLGNGVAETEGRGKIVGVPEGIEAGRVVEVEAFRVFDSGKLRNGKFVRTRDDK